MADRYGDDLRRWLRSAERLRERAISRGVFLAKTLLSRSNASLLRATRADHFLVGCDLPRLEVVVLVNCRDRVGERQARRLKYCTARSCFSALARVGNVPRLRRLPVLGSSLRE